MKHKLERDNMTSKKRFLFYLKAEKKNVFFLVLTALLFVVAQLSQPFLLGKALDYGRESNNSMFITMLAIALGLAVLGTFTGYIFEVVAGDISQNIIKKMRDDIYEKINSISIKDFDIRTSGNLLQLEIRDMENVASGIFAVFKSLVQGIFTIIVTIIMMFMVNWILALGVILLSPLSVLMSSFVARFSHKHFQKSAKLQAELNSLSLETIKNIEIVQSLNYEKESLERYKKKDEELRKESKISQFSACWVNPSTRLVNNTIYVIIGVIGIIMLAYDAKLAIVFAVMSIGRLTSFLSYTNQYSKPFNEISSVISEYETAKFSLKRVNEFLNLENDIDNGEKEINHIESIEFKNMFFSYNEKQKLIENYSLRIQKGQKVAIVGPTGAGKTTIINLIMRFYDPVSGQILVNGIDNSEIKKNSLRKNIGMVLQDTWIFDGTIYENIAYTKKNASNEEVIEAARKAHADTFIDLLPDGYDTHISAKEGLSEGQKQMIAIARVMLLNPEVVILDEATSNIDTRSEKLITNSFDEMMKEKTSIVIAHRLSTIEQADIIIVMKDGHIIETGKHEDLIKSRGFYYSMYSSQF